MAKLPPFPLRNVVTEPTRFLSSLWRDWFTALRDAIHLAVARAASTSVTAQSAAISSTTAHAVTETGLYRVSYRARITTAATVSSSLTVTVGWTDTGVACSQAGAAMTGNTTTTQQSGQVVVYADAATAITYSTAYVTSGATSMAYALAVVVEQLP